MILKFTEKQGIFFLYFVIFYAPPPFSKEAYSFAPVGQWLCQMVAQVF